ncbi:MAG: hypothetical protein AB9Q19_07700 [Candidatus Reddybacter sp.]
MDFVITWANNNSGFVGVLIFVCTLFIGWVSGIFRSLRRRPIFQLRMIPGPTQCSIISTGTKHGNYDIHRTAISIYLGISNIGSAASTIKNVQIGFHWHLIPFSWLWFKNTILYFWVEHPTIIMEDFQYSFGGNIKVFPFLFQGSNLTGNNIDTYLDVGRETNGVVYFELDDGFGGRFPSPTKDGNVVIKVAVEDVFGKKHKKNFKIPLIAIEEARKYNPSFGGTYATMHQGSA